MHIRTLLPSDAAAFQSLRLDGLREAPTAFGSSYEEECDTPVSTLAESIAKNTEGFVLGAFDGDALVGAVGIQRERKRKRAHKMVLWGMYVTPEARGKGIGRRLVDEALLQAFARAGVRQVILGVNAANAPALALYSAAGFISFGTEPACMIVDGVLQDEVHMVCVRTGGWTTR
jgi:ribosomal protein S18 acetylase RimI-like enzyme